VEAILAGVGVEEPHTDIDTQRTSVTVDTGADQLAHVVRMLHDQDIALDDVGLRRPSLDEVFLTLTGQPVTASGSATAHDAA
jgi:ABC-2 type transport system ATP-binding protein